MTSPTKKRLDAVEGQMTPKEMVLRQVDRLRQCPDLGAYTRELRKTWKSPSNKSPYAILDQQARDRHLGKGTPKPHEVNAYKKESDRLQGEFKFLHVLWMDVNGNINSRMEAAGMEAAFRLQTLQTIILQDAFGRTAKKAASWIEDFKPVDKDDKENKRIMLDELASYYVDIERSQDVSMDLGTFRLTFTSRMEGWVEDAKTLIYDLYRHRAAVAAIQAKFFDDRVILAKDVEAKFERVIKTVEDAVLRHNQYLDVRKQMFDEEWNDDEADGLFSALPGEREGRLAIDIDAMRKPRNNQGVKVLVDQWTKKAKAEAIFFIKGAYDQMQDGDDDKRFVDAFTDEILGREGQDEA